MINSDNASETAPVGEGGSLKHMDRRTFLRSLVGGVAGATAVRTWPFRVYSFPSDVVLARDSVLDQINAVSLRAFVDIRLDDWIFNDTPLLQALRKKGNPIVGATFADVFV